MFDTLLNIGSSADWITPTLAFIQDFFNGPVSDFGITAHAGWDRKDLKRLLKTQGVKVWGVMYNFTGDTLMFSVQKSQAQWVYNVLQREGIPILYAPTEVVNPSRSSPKHSHSKRSRKKKANEVGLTDEISNWLDSFEKFLDG